MKAQQNDPLQPSVKPVKIMKNIFKTAKISRTACYTAFGTFMILFSILQGCDKEAEPASVTDFENPFNIVGIYHNQGLEFILQNYISGETSDITINDTVEQLTFLLHRYVSTIPQESLLSYSAGNYKDFKTLVLKKVMEENSCKVKSANEQLSEEQRIYVGRLKNILKRIDDSDSLIVFHNVSLLEKEIWNSKMDDKDKYTLLVATAVGKFSWKYWSREKIAEFESCHSKGTNLQEIPWQQLKLAMLESDIDGGLIGMISGCIIGSIIGSGLMPGVGTLTACMMEAINGGFWGAVIGSAYGALKYLVLN
jgi:hypothetical protein